MDHFPLKGQLGVPRARKPEEQAVLPSREKQEAVSVFLSPRVKKDGCLKPTKLVRHHPTSNPGSYGVRAGSMGPLGPVLLPPYPGNRPVLSCPGNLGPPGNPAAPTQAPTLFSQLSGLVSELMRVTHGLSAASSLELAFLL